MNETLILSQIFAGLSRSMLLFFVGSGLTVIFGLLKIFNFAHGAFYMLAAYLGFTLATTMGGGLGLWGAVVVIPVVGAAVGGVFVWFLFMVTFQKRVVL